MRDGEGHGHAHGHSHHHGHIHESTAVADAIHGPEQQTIDAGHGMLTFSIFEAGVPPRFRLTGVASDAVEIETLRDGDRRQAFLMLDRGLYWESRDEIPEPHGFSVTVTTEHSGHFHR